MNIEIIPNNLRGEIISPPSKSISHRAIICAALSEDISKISNIDLSDDIKATVEAMKSLGASIERIDNELIIKGIYNKDNMGNSATIDVIDCKESGSTLRFIFPILTLFNRRFEIKTSGNLINRPMDVYFEIFDKSGIEYSVEGRSIFVSGGKIIDMDRIFIRGDISSQFISGLLMYLPMLERNTEIEIVGKLESKNYVDLTIDIMRAFGVFVENIDYKTFRIRGNQKYTSNDFEVESDYSQAAFFVVANEIGNELDIRGLSKRSKQGDRCILDIVEEFKNLKKFGIFEGCKAVIFNEDSEIIEEKSVCKDRKLGDGYYVDGKDIPDIVPILSLLFAFIGKKITILNLDRLKIKESDRLENTKTELSKLGVDIKIEKIDGKSALVINGIETEKLKGGVIVDSHKDHRLAMMIAIAATRCEDKITILDADCVSKSYPNFWNEYVRLGGDISVCDLGKER